ncbi:PREDICTED: uncharacterized protein LOC105586634 [Cercocebus atys]|uniref:uncharacterized protein LOC105586634 n=1 Tax=Cercocebus atys TaxID=9531 RepID=UPI0005F4159B|nr:PREDICTED: uncharacterized protein LOC105586634 [Cercocebus atys]
MLRRAWVAQSKGLFENPTRRNSAFAGPGVPGRPRDPGPMTPAPKPTPPDLPFLRLFLVAALVALELKGSGCLPPHSPRKNLVFFLGALAGRLGGRRVKDRAAQPSLPTVDARRRPTPQVRVRRPWAPLRDRPCPAKAARLSPLLVPRHRWGGLRKGWEEQRVFLFCLRRRSPLKSPARTDPEVEKGDGGKLVPARQRDSGRGGHPGSPENPRPQGISWGGSTRF